MCRGLIESTWRGQNFLQPLESWLLFPHHHNLNNVAHRSVWTRQKFDARGSNVQWRLHLALHTIRTFRDSWCKSCSEEQSRFWINNWSKRMNGINSLQYVPFLMSRFDLVQIWNIYIPSNNRFLMDHWLCGNCNTQNDERSLHRCMKCDEPRGTIIAQVSLDIPQNGIGNIIAIIVLIAVIFLGYSLLWIKGIWLKQRVGTEKTHCKPFDLAKSEQRVFG